MSERPPAPVSTEARGKVRRFKAALAVSSAQTEKALKAPEINDYAMALAKSGAKGRARAAMKLRRMIPNVRWWPNVHSRCVLGAYLSPVEPIIHDPSHIGQTQNAVSVRYIFIGLQSRDYLNPLCSMGQWTLEVPDHALGRMFERDPAIDMIEALFVAHETLLAADGEDIPVPGTIFFTTAGNGAFLCELIAGEDRTAQTYHDTNLIYARAKTWLHANQLHDDQVPWPSGSPSLGESVLLPMPLRDLVFDKDGVRVLF